MACSLNEECSNRCDEMLERAMQKAGCESMSAKAANMTAQNCALPDSQKSDCGWNGVNQQTCEQKGCCWQSSSTGGVPWCFHKGASPSPGPAPVPQGPVIRGIAYGALPSKNSHGPYAEDMVQAGYATEWGPSGRDDLGSMKTLGANTVRLYHSLGSETNHDHGAFLDRAHELELDVFPGVHTYLPCPNNDCYDSWKQAVKAGFQKGFQKDGNWHPAVSTIILLNEPDFTPGGDWCRVKKALSAMEGLLDAEKEMNVKPGRVKLTVTWSFGMHTSVDGKVRGPGIFGFQDMVAGTANPGIAQYTPRSSQAELLSAFKSRWIHSMNTQAPWSYVKSVVEPHYAQFLPHQWFIGEYGANGQTQTTIQNDLQGMVQYTNANSGFAGACMFQFQSAYEKGGSELNFGIFSLGDRKIGDTGEVCSGGRCGTYPVYCLETHLPWFNGKPELDHRAEAVARAWGGSAQNKGRCSSAIVV